MSLVLAPGPKVVSVQVVVPPVLLAAGKVQLRLGSSVLPDTKVVLAGVALVTWTFEAGSGPLLLIHRT